MQCRQHALHIYDTSFFLNKKNHDFTGDMFDYFKTWLLFNTYFSKTLKVLFLRSRLLITSALSDKIIVKGLIKYSYWFKPASNFILLITDPSVLVLFVLCFGVKCLCCLNLMYAYIF